MKVWSLIFSCLFIIWGGWPFRAFTQNFDYQAYNVDSGLPSNEVYCTLEDSKGFIWIGTDKGVCRYDGSEFKVFTTNDGLPDNTIFGLHEDHSGRIWFHSFNGEIGFYHNEVFHTLDFGDFIYKKTRIESISVSPQDLVTVIFWQEFHKKLQFKLNEFDFDESSSPTLLSHPDDFHSISQKLQWKYSEMIMNQAQSSQLIKVGDSLVYITCRTNSYLILDTNFRLKAKVTLGKSPLALLGKTKKGWFIRASNGTIFKHSFNNLRIPTEETSFDSFECSNVYIDSYGSTWISTLNKGVVFQPSNKIQITQFPESLYGKGFLSFNLNENALMLSNRNGDLFTLNRQNGRKAKRQYGYGEIPKIRQSKNGFLVAMDFGLLLFNNSGRFLEKIEQENHRLIRDALLTSNGDLISCGRSFININNNRIIDPEASRLVVIEIQGDTIWGGGLNGLFAYSIKHVDKIRIPNNPFLKKRVTDLQLINSTLLVGTRGSGLCVKNGENVEIISTKNGLISNSIESIEVENDHIVWIASSRGLSKIIFTSFMPLRYSITNIGRADGILSNSIKSIKLHLDTLHVLSDNSIYRFHKNYSVDTLPPRFYLTHLFVNDKRIRLDTSLIFPYNENNFEFGFQGIYFKDHGGCNYEYSLDGGVSWTLTNNVSLSFHNLSSGDYTFMIRAVNANGIRSKTEKIDFTILPLFLNTWWFYSLSLACILLIVILISRQLIRQSMQKNRMTQLELTALRSQMNPHFTFNSINSIQHFLAKNTPQEAIDFTSKFSRLIRMILNNSSKELISVKDEISAVKLYLDIEKTRLNNRFDYSIELASEIDENFDRIPSIIIQPYVENAIWHGLLNKEGKGTIKIKLEKKEKGIKCTIEDDGIGRLRAQELKSNSQMREKSFGMSLTRERVKLLNGKKQKLNVLVIDLKDNLGKPVGTRVEIYTVER